MSLEAMADRHVRAKEPSWPGPSALFPVLHRRPCVPLNTSALPLPHLLCCQNLYPQQHRACHGFIRHKDIMISPSLLRMHNIPFTQVG